MFIHKPWVTYKNNFGDSLLNPFRCLLSRNLSKHWLRLYNFIPLSHSGSISLEQSTGIIYIPVVPVYYSNLIWSLSDSSLLFSNFNGLLLGLWPSQTRSLFRAFNLFLSASWNAFPLELPWLTLTHSLSLSLNFLPWKELSLGTHWPNLECIQLTILSYCALLFSFITFYYVIMYLFLHLFV